MSIAKRTGQGESITEGWRAFDLFTDRHDLIRAFTSYLNEPPTPERIIFFYGEGGNGKSLLLKFLQEHCCKYIDPRNWEWVKSKSDSEFLEDLKNISGAEDVPAAAIDFNPGPGGDDSIQDPISALLTLRRALHHPSLHFPMFDFACAWHLARGGKLTEQQRQYLFMTEGTKLIAKIIDGISKSLYGAVATTVLAIYNKDLSQWFNLYTRRRGLNKETIKEIQALAPESKLIDRLPQLFAEDLNTAMLIKGAPTKVALFFDAHESFWGIERKLSEELFFQRDEWLRTLLAHLEPSSGIVTVVAGRERPRWAEASKPGTIIPSDYVDLRHVGPLPAEYAFEYLRRAEIDDPVMQECLVSCSQVSIGQVHPLYLGLCADVVLAARAKGEILAPEEFQGTKQAADKATELTRRLLRYVDDDIAYPVRALSACRAFDRDLYFKLGEALKLGVTEQSFQALIRLSFVWRVERRGEGWYRIHDTLRRLFHEHGDEITGSADKFLYKYYSTRGDSVALAESTYHRNRLGRENRIDAWVAAFNVGMEFARYDLCRLLLEVRSELKINRGVDLGRLLDQEGDYFELIAKYDEAEHSYLGAVAAFEEAVTQHPESPDIRDLMGHTLTSLGKLYADLSRHNEAYKSYRRALALFDNILKHNPDHACRTRRGNTLVLLGQLLSVRSKTKSAVRKYQDAIGIFEEDVNRWPQDANSHSRLGSAYTALGNCQFELSQYDEAIESFGKAVSGYDRAIRQIPILHRFYHNKATALVDLGEVQFRLKQYDEAERNYLDAITCFDQALRHSPEISACWDGRGVALRHLGDVLVVQSRDEEAMNVYQKAVASFDEALGLAPGDIAPSFNKATALESLGQLSFDKGDTETWAESYRRALAMFDALIERAPDFISAYNNKGIALLRFGKMHVLQAKFVEAAEITRRAIATFDEAIKRSPGFVFGRNNKGRALGALSLCLYFMGDYEPAAEASRAALAEFSWSTETAPRDKRIHDEKAGMRDFLSIFDGHLPPDYKPSATPAAQQSEERFDLLIEHLGESSESLGFKESGDAQRDLETLLQLLTGTEADNKVDDLFATFSKQYEAAVAVNPHNYLVLCHLGGLYHQWAKIKMGVEADRLFSLACEKYEAAFQNPTMHQVLNDWGIVLCDWAKTKSGAEADRLFALACKKHEASLKIFPEKQEAYLNWGGALYAQALTKTGKNAAHLLERACEKYEAGLGIKPDDFMLMHNWGLALMQRAFSTSGGDEHVLFAQACEKFESVLKDRPEEQNSLEFLRRTLSHWGDVLRNLAVGKPVSVVSSLYDSLYRHLEGVLSINPDQEEIYYFWGNALQAQAGLVGGQDAEQLLKLAIEKYETAAKLNSDLFMVLSNWGAALGALAKSKPEEADAEADRLFEAACEKFEAVIMAEPDLWEAHISFGAVYAEWAKRKSGGEAEVLRSKAGERFEAVVIGGPDRFKCFALQNWGTTLMQQAAERLRTNGPIDRSADPVATDLLNAAIGKFEKAHQIDPSEAEYLVSWGRTLEFLAISIPWETAGMEAASLYSQSFDKFSVAQKISPQDASIRAYRVNSLSCWAHALSEWAKSEKERDPEEAARLSLLACEKLNKAYSIDPSNAKTLRDWGITLYEVAEITKGKKYVTRLTSAAQKLEKAMRMNPDDVKTQLYWSRATRAVAMTQMSDEERQLLEFLLESIRKSGYEV
jgi:tetratricopeptide (TPR) repeat protein